MHKKRIKKFKELRWIIDNDKQRRESAGREKKRWEKKKEIRRPSLLWMRFTLADRGPNISVGKPIYLRLCARGLPPRTCMQIEQVGQYVANICLDFSLTCRLRIASTAKAKDFLRRPSEIRASFNIAFCIYMAFIII